MDANRSHLVSLPHWLAAASTAHKERREHGSPQLHMVPRRGQRHLDGPRNSLGLFPAANLTDNDITATSPLALNMIKTDIGGGLIAASTLIGLFALKGNQWFVPAAIITGAYLILRTISWTVDGSHPMIISGVVLEALVLAALFYVKRARDRSHSVSARSKPRTD